MGEVFRYAIATARVESNPTSALGGALQRHAPTSHPALTTRSELGGVTRAVHGYEGQPSLVAALRFRRSASPGPERLGQWSGLNWI